MENKLDKSLPLLDRVIMALVFLVIGSLIIAVFSPWRPLLDKTADYLGRILLVAALSVAVMAFRRVNKYQQHSKILIGLLIFAIAVSLDWIFANYLIHYLGVTDVTPVGWVIQKLNECLIILSVIIPLSLMTGSNLGSIYLQKGDLKLGLSIGLVTFILAVTFSIPMANLFYGNNLTLARILPWAPWVLLFVFGNAAMEEIMFRGLFLRKLEPFFGKFSANLMIAVVFTLIHGSVTYTVDNYIFLAVLFPLALAWGYLTQKSDAVWGSIWFHAGMDIPIMLGIFSNLP